MTRWVGLGRTLADEARARVMGIVNATPDSFSDGGLAARLDDAIARGLRLIAEGAEILDVGGESSRPGAEAVPLDEEVRRVLPAIEALAAGSTVPISVDTTKPEVARLALLAGASVVNDITGLDDPAMLAVVAESAAGVVLMHMRGDPRAMLGLTDYDDVVDEVLSVLAAKVDRAERAGIARERIAVDPGIGFAKTHDQNLALLRATNRFAALGCVVLVGTSRKGLLGKITGRPVGERVAGTLASSLAAVARGARVVRVHDAGPMVDALKVWDAIEHGLT